MLAILTSTKSIYSSYEHSFLAPASLPQDRRNSSSPGLQTLPTHPPLPLDIILEALISTLLLTIVIVSSAPQLRPIQWNEWAGKIEREGWDPHAETYDKSTIPGDSGEATGNGKGKGGAGNPYKVLEERRAFSDVRVSRVAR